MRRMGAAEIETTDWNDQFRTTFEQLVVPIISLDFHPLIRPHSQCLRGLDVKKVAHPGNIAILWKRPLPSGLAPKGKRE